MKIPSKFNLLGETINVKFGDKEKDFNKDGVRYGYWCSDDSEIVLEPGMTPMRTAEVFLHEVFEAIVMRLDLKVSHQTLTSLCAVLWNVLNQIELEEVNGYQGGEGKGKDPYIRI